MLRMEVKRLHFHYNEDAFLQKVTNVVLHYIQFQIVIPIICLNSELNLLNQFPLQCFFFLFFSTFVVSCNDKKKQNEINFFIEKF